MTGVEAHLGATSTKPPSGPSVSRGRTGSVSRVAPTIRAMRLQLGCQQPRASAHSKMTVRPTGHRHNAKTRDARQVLHRTYHRASTSVPGVCRGARAEPLRHHDPPNRQIVESLLRSAERRCIAPPRKRCAMWVRQVGYNAKPPNPHRVRYRYGRSLAGAAPLLLWKQGAILVTWYLIRDSPPIQLQHHQLGSATSTISLRPRRWRSAFRSWQQ
jgi:hypothetical protein